MFSQVCIILWDEWFWLPQRYKWKDFQSPSALDLSFPLILGLVLWAFKVYIVNRYILESFTLKFSTNLDSNVQTLIQVNCIHNQSRHNEKQNFKREQHKLGTAEELRSQQAVFAANKQWSNQNLENLSYHSWRLAYLSSSWIFAILFLVQESWFWNLEDCWIGYPHQRVSGFMFWYYSSTIGFYWALILYQLSESKRRRHYKSQVKHALNITILYALWMAGLMRIATLIVAINGAAKIPFEAAQISNLFGRRKLYFTLFLVYVVTWLISRLIIFPSLVLKSTLIDARDHLGVYPVYYLLNALVFLLLVLHVVRAFTMFQVDTQETRNGNVDIEDSILCAKVD